jgi:hypothetical protein
MLNNKWIAAAGISKELTGIAQKFGGETWVTGFGRS